MHAEEETEQDHNTNSFHVWELVPTEVDRVRDHHHCEKKNLKLISM